MDRLRRVPARPRPRSARGRRRRCPGDEAGNVICRIPATAGETGTPIMFCAHVDTVEPTAPIEPVVSDGIVTNAHETILGGDNKAAVASMLEGVRRVLAENRPHAGIELILSVQEEIGLLGVKALDCSQLAARIGYVYDHAGADRRPRQRLPVAVLDRRDVPRARGARRHRAGGGPQRDRGRRARAGRDALRPPRRRDDGQRRHDRRRHRAQRRAPSAATCGSRCARAITSARSRRARRCSTRSRTRPTPRSASSRRPRRSSTGPTSCGAAIPSCRSPGRRSRAAATRPSCTPPAAAPTRTSSTRTASPA